MYVYIYRHTMSCYNSPVKCDSIYAVMVVSGNDNENKSYIRFKGKHLLWVKGRGELIITKDVTVPESNVKIVLLIVWRKKHAQVERSVEAIHGLRRDLHLHNNKVLGLGL